MPGGLTRVAASAETHGRLDAAGGGSKDTWVLADGPVSAFSLLPRRIRPVELAAAAATCPAGTPTTSTGWAATSSGAEGVVRLLRGDPRPARPRSPGLAEVARAARPASRAHLPDRRPIPASSTEPARRVDEPEGELLSVIFDRERPGSLAVDARPCSSGSPPRSATGSPSTCGGS